MILSAAGLPDLPGTSNRIYGKVVKIELFQHGRPPSESLRIHLPDFWVVAYEALILPPYVLIEDLAYHAIYNSIYFINLIL